MKSVQTWLSSEQPPEVECYFFSGVFFDFVLCLYRTCTSLRKNQSKVKLTTRNHRKRAGSFFLTFFPTNQRKKHIFCSLIKLARIDNL